MTIAERINLHRCGYSRQEIEELAAAEKAELETVVAKPVEPAAPAADPIPAPNPTPAADPKPAADSNAEILAAIKDLTAAIHARNINTQPQPPQPTETVTDLINKL